MWLELQLLFFDVVAAGVVTVLAFHGVGCVHLSSLAVTVLMTSWSFFCLFKRLLHDSSLALTTLRTEVMLILIGFIPRTVLALEGFLLTFYRIRFVMHFCRSLE